MKPSIFDDLFVLELANNHWGKVGRGQRIINEFGAVVRRNRVNAAIKLQFRDVDTFIHKDHRFREDHRYIKKVGATHLRGQPTQPGRGVRGAGMLTMVTPFDEISVDKAVEYDVEMLRSRVPTSAIGT